MSLCRNVRFLYCRKNVDIEERGRVDTYTVYGAQRGEHRGLREYEICVESDQIPAIRRRTKGQCGKINLLNVEREGAEGERRLRCEEETRVRF